VSEGKFEARLRNQASAARQVLTDWREHRMNPSAPFVGLRPEEADILAEMLEAVRAMSQYEDRWENCRGVDWSAYERAVATLAALDEAGKK